MLPVTYNSGLIYSRSLCSEDNISENFPNFTVNDVNLTPFGPKPQKTVCNYCHVDIVTEISHEPGLFTWILSGSIVLIGCCIGCCFIPCCLPQCHDIHHKCPHCHALIGVYRRI